MLSLRRSLAAGAAVALIALVGSTTSPHSVPGYLARQGLHQASLLIGRMPVGEAQRLGLLTDKQGRALVRVEDVLAFGAEIGLSTGSSYESIHPTWDRKVFNVSACNPVAFKPVRWTFPVVGRVPYLGFFDEPSATAASRHLHAKGYDVYQRTAGAYSMLGWLEDPLLPHMLKWDESRLAGTLLHELTHATLWVPGSVSFNESFANFVGNIAAMQYLESRHGEESAQVSKERDRRGDRRAYRAMLREVYKELDTLYKDGDRSRAEKLRTKAAILAALPQRTSQLELHRSAAYVRSVQKSPWNNARLVQYRTYNRSTEWFAALLDQEDGDLLRFIGRVEEIGRSGDDPYEALAHAVGADPKAEDTLSADGAP